MRPKSGNISLNYRQRRIASFIRRPNSTPRNAAARRQSFILSRKISKYSIMEDIDWSIVRSRIRRFLSSVNYSADFSTASFTRSWISRARFSELGTKGPSAERTLDLRTSDLSAMISAAAIGVTGAAVFSSWFPIAEIMSEISFAGIPRLSSRRKAIIAPLCA